MTGFKQNLKELWSSLLTFIYVWAHTPHHNQINILIFLWAKKLSNGQRITCIIWCPWITCWLFRGWSRGSDHSHTRTRRSTAVSTLLKWQNKMKWQVNRRFFEKFITKKKKKQKKSEPIILQNALPPQAFTVNALLMVWSTLHALQG